MILQPAIRLAILAVLLSSCAANEVVPVDPGVPAGEYSRTVQPVLTRHCGGSTCHGGGTSGFAGGLDLTSHAGALRGSRYGTVVVPGLPYMSHLVQTINRTDTTLSPVSSLSMPAGRDPLSSADLRTIVAWIASGARDDMGRLPFPEPRPLGKAFFTSQFVDLVGVLDLATGLIMRYVPVGNHLPFSGPPQSPHNVQVDDQGRFYYVTLIASNVLRKFDAATQELVGETAVGLQPAHVVVTADGTTAYVTNFNEGSGVVFKVTTSSMQVERVITHPLMRKTHGARLSHDGAYLYVASNTGDLLNIIATATDSVVASLHVGTGLPSPGTFIYKPYQIAVRSDDRFIFITCSGNVDGGGHGAVSVFERTGDAFSLAGVVTVGAFPLQCEVTRNGRFLYVCNRGSNSVSVIDTDTRQVASTIEDVGPQPHGIDITEDSRTVYVTCENVSGEPPHHPATGGRAPGFVVVIDAATNQVVRRIEVGGFAAGISLSPGRGN